MVDRLRATLLSAAAALLCGCATWGRHGVVIRPPQRIRVAVLPVHADLRVKRLADIYTVQASSPVPSDESAAIAGRLAEATEAITRRLESGLKDSYLFDVAESTAAGAAQAVLTVRLSGYGRIKGKWLWYLIGSGFAEGAVQGAVVGTAAGGSAWVAAGIAAEEVLQEALTWGGGAWVFGRVFTPVILEGRLTSVADGKTLWSGTEFVRLDRKGLKRFSKEERGRKELRLRVTAEKAADELVADLEKRAWRNVRKEAAR